MTTERPRRELVRGMRFYTSAGCVVSRRAMTKRSPSAVDLLLSTLDLEEIEVNRFRGRSPQEERQRVFGGQVAGQALVAAGRTS